MPNPTNKKIFAATALRSFWGPKTPDAFLGRWCLPYSLEVEQPALVARVLDYPWASRESRVAAYRYCTELKRSLLIDLTVLLNGYHRANYSMRAWNLMLGAWLHRMVMTGYHHYGCLEEARARIPNAFMFGPNRGVCPPADTTGRLYRDLWGSYRHLELIAELAEGMGIPCERIQPAETDLPDGKGPIAHSGEALVASGGIARLRLGARSISRGIARQIACHADSILYNAAPSAAESARLAISSLCRIFPLPILSLAGARWPSANGGAREELSRELRRRSGPSGFSTILAGALPRFLPISLLEGFSELNRNVSSYFPRSPSRIVSSMAWIGDDAFSLWAAERSEKGAVLISAQHGGGYGVREMLSGSELVESEVVDRFLSWGPATQVGANSVTLPVLPRFYVKRPPRTDGKLLYIGGTGGLLFPYGFMSAVDGPDAIEYLERQKAFFTTLPDEIRRAFLLRPHPLEFGWSEKARLGASLPGIAFDDYTVDLVERLYESSLVVVDNMNTTYLQAIGSGIPTVFVWDIERWSLNLQATRNFERLREVGVFHSDPISAASQVAEIAENPMAWWHSKPVSEAVSSFLKCYFQVGPAWLSAWRRELLA